MRAPGLFCQLCWSVVCGTAVMAIVSLRGVIYREPINLALSTCSCAFIVTIV